MSSGGESVGLPRGISGNSEVGHLNLGAGRPVRQDLVRINEAIKKKTLADLPPLVELVRYAQSHGKRLHLMGLLSDGAVHSHIDHLKELFANFSSYPNLNLYLHAFMDGRDTSQMEGPKYLNEILKLNLCQWGSMQGRSVGMDRDRRWEKIELAYKTMTGQGAMTDKTPLDYLKSQYAQGRYDEFVTPVLFDKEAAIREGTLFFL